MELKQAQYRAAMVDRRYQAQMKCKACGNWILTNNLEVFKDKKQNMHADAVDVTCGQTGCGEVIKKVVFRDWQNSAPVKWRHGDRDEG